MLFRNYFICGVALTMHATDLHADSRTPRPDNHAPVGVMGDHTHKSREWMFSYRFMTMAMQGNLKGSGRIDPDTIATSESNRFFGMPGQPPTLRIVPLEMTMDMHMLGLMYAPTDKVTLMLMANYLDKEMRHVTYSGGMGTTVLGNFSTGTSGWGDTTLTGLFSFPHSGLLKAHAILGLSIPTGSIDATDRVLTPMNMTPTVRVPYPMQLGSGSYDPIVGFNLSGRKQRLGWGTQWRSTFRASDNDENYSLGDEHRATGWLSWRLADPASVSLRLEYFSRDNVSGRDAQIMGPVQTADPDRQGVDRLDLAIGINIVAMRGAVQGWRLGLEYLLPLDQDLDGPQLETDSQLIIGIQKAF